MISFLPLMMQGLVTRLFGRGEPPHRRRGADPGSSAPVSLPGLSRQSMNTGAGHCVHGSDQVGDNQVGDKGKVQTSPSSSRNLRQQISGIGEPGRLGIPSAENPLPTRAPRSRLSGFACGRDDEGKVVLGRNRRKGCHARAPTNTVARNTSGDDVRGGGGDARPRHPRHPGICVSKYPGSGNPGGAIGAPTPSMRSSSADRFIAGRP